MRAQLVALPFLLLASLGPALAWDYAEDPEDGGTRVTAWADDLDSGKWQLAVTCNDQDPATAELYLYTGAPWDEKLAAHTSEALSLAIDGRDYPFKGSFVQAGDEAALMTSANSDTSVEAVFDALSHAVTSITLTYGGVHFRFGTDQVEDSVGAFLEACTVVTTRA